MESQMRIAADEVEIRGSWVMVNGRMTEDDQCRRISALIKTELQYVATSNDGWEKLYRDPRETRGQTGRFLIFSRDGAHSMYLFS